MTKRIYDPVTGKYYELIHREPPRRHGMIKGLWKRPKEKKSLLDLIVEVLR